MPLDRDQRQQQQRHPTNADHHANPSPRRRHDRDPSAPSDSTTEPHRLRTRPDEMTVRTNAGGAGVRRDLESKDSKERVKDPSRQQPSDRTRHVLVPHVTTTDSKQQTVVSEQRRGRTSKRYDEYVAQKMLAKSKLEEREVAAGSSRTKTPATSRGGEQPAAAKPVATKETSRKDSNNIRLRVATDAVRETATNADDEPSTTTTPQRRRPRHDSNSSIPEDVAELNGNTVRPAPAPQSARTPTTGLSKRVVDKNASSSNARLESSASDLKSGNRTRRNPAQTASDTESDGHASRSRRNVKKAEAASATSATRRPDVPNVREDKESGSSAKDASTPRIRQITSPITKKREPRSNEKFGPRNLKKEDTSENSSDAEDAPKLAKMKPSKQKQSQSTDSLSENEDTLSLTTAKFSKPQRKQPVDSDDDEIAPVVSKMDGGQSKKGKPSTSRPNISDSSDAEPVKQRTKPTKKESNQSSEDDDDDEEEVSSERERITKKNVVALGVAAKVEIGKVPPAASSKLLSSKPKSKSKKEISDSSDTEDGHTLEVDESKHLPARKGVKQSESIKVDVVEQAVKPKQKQQQQKHQQRRDVSDSSSDGEVQVAAVSAPKSSSKSKKKGLAKMVEGNGVVASKETFASEIQSKQQSPEPPQIPEKSTDAKKKSKRQKDKMKEDKPPPPKESPLPSPPQKPKSIAQPTTTTATTEPTTTRPRTNFKKLSGKRRSCVIMIANPKLREIVKRRALATTKQHGRFELLKESGGGSSEESKGDLEVDGDDVEEVDAWSDDGELDVGASSGLNAKVGGGGRRSFRKSVFKVVDEGIVGTQVSQDTKKKSSSKKAAVKSKNNVSSKPNDMDFEKELKELELLEDKAVGNSVEVSGSPSGHDHEVKKARDVEKKDKQPASKATEAPRVVAEDSRQQNQTKKLDVDARVSSSSSAPGSKRAKAENPPSGSQTPKDFLKDKKPPKHDTDSANSSSDESHHSSSFRTRGQRKLVRKSSQESSPMKRKNGSNNSRKIESSDDDDVKEDKPVVPERKSPTVPYRRKISSDTSDAEVDVKASAFLNKKASMESLVRKRVPSPKRRSGLSGSSEDEKLISLKGTNSSKKDAEKSGASRVQNVPPVSSGEAGDSSGRKGQEKKPLNQTSEQSDSRAYQLPPRRTQYTDDSSDDEGHQKKQSDDEIVVKSVAKENQLQKPASNNSRIKSPQRRAVVDDSSDEEGKGSHGTKPVPKDTQPQKPVSSNSRIKSPQRRAAVNDSSDDDQRQEKGRDEKLVKSVAKELQKPASNSRIKSPQRRAVDQSSSDEEAFKSPKAAPILRKTTANSSKEAISSRDAPPIRVHSPRRRDSLMSSDDEKSVRRQSSLKISSRSGSMKRPSRSESLRRPDRSESLKRQAGRGDIERPGFRKNASRSRKTDDSSDEEQDRAARKVTSPRTRRPPSGMSVHSEVSARRNRAEVKADTPSLISLAESRISIPSASPSPNMTDKPPKLRISQLSRVKNEYPDSDDSTATKEPIRKAPSPVVLSPKPSPRSSLTNPTPSPPTQKTGFFRSLWGGGGSKPAPGATAANQGSAPSVAEVAPPALSKDFESDKNPSMGRSIASSATNVSQSTITSVPEKVETKTEVEGAPKKTVLGWIFGGKKPAAGGASGAPVGDVKTSSDVLEDSNADVGRKSEDAASDSDSGSDQSRRSTMKGLGIQRRRSASVSSQEEEKPKSGRRYTDSSTDEETNVRRPGKSVSQTRRGNPAAGSPQVNAAGRPLRGGRPQESRALDKHPNDGKNLREDGNPRRPVVGRRAERPVDDMSDFSPVSD
ncbi:hypothetical protein HDU81_001022 [Chytriomyces hyalinus]|nr:hypothetical protein HDU81_001022 [Chytriomyces hyalinus]